MAPTDTGDFVSEILDGFTAERISASEEQPGVVNGQAASRGDRPSLEILTNREHEVLELLARRRQNKEIAAELFISTQTVNSHLHPRGRATPGGHDSGSGLAGALTTAGSAIT